MMKGEPHPMETPNNPVPVVLVIAGLDPTGGAGLQADIETLASQGCHCAPVISTVTVQDTRNVIAISPVAATLVIQQARAILEDMPVKAIKLGLLGSVEIIEAVHSILFDYPHLPVVFDPILAAGGGAELASPHIINAMQNLLHPHTTVITPNSVEARRLATNADTLEACGMALLQQGCEYVLITGTHEESREVTNTLFSNQRVIERFHWPRLANTYHGSGCTLAACIAGLLAQGADPVTAVHQAQEYTWQTLQQGYRAGMGQLLPNRFYWAHHAATDA
jgi:hydroxymethylpyrimidine/phosphomethylpyrimidine kinase